MIQGGSAPARIQVSKIENMVMQLREQLTQMADRPEVIASKLDHHVQVCIYDTNFAAALFSFNLAISLSDCRISGFGIMMYRKADACVVATKL